MNNNNGYKKKYKNVNVSDDTVAIKEINSYLNKLTDKDYYSINKNLIIYFFLNFINLSAMLNHFLLSIKFNM